MESCNKDFNILTSKDFNPDKYVRELSQNCVGGPELLRVRKKIHAISETTNNSLRKNVYHNYMQFIETAKEISHLEGEMYQLSHLLSEQKSLLSNLYTTSISGNDKAIVAEIDNKTDSEEKNRQKLVSILEKVEGCKQLLDFTGRTYLFEGDLLEVDPVENNSIKPIHGYLFSDSFMTCCRNSNNRSLMKYTFEAMYELKSLGVVNVRDIGSGNKHTFKLLIFPDTRVFQCNTNSNKKKWLDEFDQAKKLILTKEQLQRRDSVVEKMDKMPSRTGSIDSPNHDPFEEDKEESRIDHPIWFVEIPEELDVCIAQRQFEEALNHIQKTNSYLKQYETNLKTDHVIIEIKRKVEQRHNQLTQVLMKELDINPDKSLQGGLRAARRAVRLLNQLGCSTQSCDLLLKLCSSMLKGQYKRVKRESSTIMYVRHLSSVVLTNLCYMTEEFLRAFPDSSECFSAYIVWITAEIAFFTSHFVKQIFVPQTSFSTLTECVLLVRTQCERLSRFGVDVCYQINGTLRSPLVQALRDARDKSIDASKIRANEDKWIPMNLKTKSTLNRFLHEFSEIDLKLDHLITGDVWIQLTSNTIAFTRLFIAFVNDCLKLHTTELLHTIDDVLYAVFDVQLKHIEISLKNEKQPQQRKLIINNAKFLLITLIEVCQKKYMKNINFHSEILKKLQTDYSALLKGTSPMDRNTQKKYSSTELI